MGNEHISTTGKILYWGTSEWANNSRDRLAAFVLLKTD